MRERQFVSSRLTPPYLLDTVVDPSCCPLLKLQSLFEAEQRLDLVTSPKELTRYLKIEGDSSGGRSESSGDATRERVLLLAVHDDRGIIPGSVDNTSPTQDDACWSAALAACQDAADCSMGTLALSSIMEPAHTLLEPSGSGASPGSSGSGAGPSGSSQGWGLRPRLQVQDALVRAAAGLLDGGVDDSQEELDGQDSGKGDLLLWLALQQVRVVLVAARGSGGLPAACLAALALCSVGHRRFSVLNDCS